MSTNAELQNAKIAKKDEFYTMYSDIELELSKYKKQFKNAVVLCNCDDPTWSNFWRYLHLNFNKLKIKKLISTHYQKGEASDKLIYEGGNDSDIESGVKIDLTGDGDFRSQECLDILDEADIVVTNPPFSLFREYVSVLVKHNKQMIIIGNMNSITTKDIFPLFRDGKLWYGQSIHSGDRKFYVPDDYPLKAASCGVDKNKKRYIKVKGVRWFTNIGYKDRHIPLECTKKYDAHNYPKYDNYDAININKTSDIPLDYIGVMGVPITFIDKYCPEQFEILGTSADLAQPIVLPNNKKGTGRFYMNGKRLYDRIVIRYTDEWIESHPDVFAHNYFDINNRRYTGSKHKLMPWIKEIIYENCEAHSSLFDVFGGTGVVTASLLDTVKSVIINDFLYSNEAIYRAFFGNEDYDILKLKHYCNLYNNINKTSLPTNYISDNYGDKYFRYDDAKLIGYIRQNIEDEYSLNNISEKEYYILLASLLYSFDRCANTVGHYEAYIKEKEIRSEFVYKLIKPITSECDIHIYREDANKLAPKVQADIAFLDPPYNSRQYSRFYHVMETVTKWDKPVLSGVAMKPPEENMSEYCRNSAAQVFEDLVASLNVKYIIVTYNNTYNSKSNSSQNKITLEQIRSILEKRGTTKIYSKSYHRFNAGKTDKTDHREYVFLTIVEK